MSSEELRSDLVGRGLFALWFLSVVRIVCASRQSEHKGDEHCTRFFRSISVPPVT